MTDLLTFWTLVIVIAAALAALRDIYDDGYGHRPPPRSHLPDQFDPSLQPRSRRSELPPRW